MAFPTLKQIEEYNNFQQHFHKRFPGKSKIPNIREYFERKTGTKIPLAKKKGKKKNKLKIKKT